MAQSPHRRTQTACSADLRSASAARNETASGDASDAAYFAQRLAIDGCAVRGSGPTPLVLRSPD
jgi:hypothetical protein